MGERVWAFRKRQTIFCRFRRRCLSTRTLLCVLGVVVPAVKTRAKISRSSRTAKRENAAADVTKPGEEKLTKVYRRSKISLKIPKIAALPGTIGCQRLCRVSV